EVAAPQRPEGQRRRTAGEIETARAGPDRQQQPLPDGQTQPLDDARAGVENLARQRDLDWTDRRAGVAAHAQALGARRVGEAVVEGRVHQPDGARVDVAEHVPADDLVGRTYVRTGRAADAAQGRAHVEVGAHGKPPVVQENDV